MTSTPPIISMAAAAAFTTGAGGAVGDAPIPKYPAETERVLLNPDEPDDEYQMMGVTAVPKKKDGWTRIWVDGCFDMLHFGHTNALRQAYNLGPAGKTELFVGSHSDEEICKVKGPPIMKAAERYEALRGCKWVDFVVENYPYSTRLKDMIRFEVDFVAHGDDVSVGADGRNSYQEIIDAGKFRVFKRTDGISTTDLVGRMLLCTKQHMVEQPSDEVTRQLSTDSASPVRPRLSYLTTSSKIAQFSNKCSPEDHNKIVYINGSFDLFHYGHMRVLEMAKKLVPNAYVIAGIAEDKVVNHYKGDTNYPIMNLNERVLGVLSCRYVDEVIMGVPYEVTDDLIEKLGIDVVIAGVARDEVETDVASPTHPALLHDAYGPARKRGILKLIDSACELTTSGLIERVVAQLPAFVDRQRKKAVKDKAAVENKPAEYQNVKEINK